MPKFSHTRDLAASEIGHFTTKVCSHMENAEIRIILDGLDLSNVQCPLSKVQSTNFMKVHAFFKIERLMLVMIVDDSVHVVHYSVNVVDDDCILFVDDSVTVSVVDGHVRIFFHS